MSVTFDNRISNKKRAFAGLVVVLVVFLSIAMFTVNLKTDSQKSKLTRESLYYEKNLSVNTNEDIDQEIIDFSTFLGGTSDEQGTASYLEYLGATVVDSQGNIIVVGRTASVDFPTLNAYKENKSGGIDITITKFDVNGSLIFSTYFGGMFHEWATAVEVDSMDNIVFAGITGSFDFPLLNPYQNKCLGGSEGNADCFVAKLSKDGQTLLYSTYLGGTNSDWCYAMAVDANDRIAITGTTLSTNFPLVNATQNTHQGSLDAFVTLIDADGQSLLFSTYLGTTGIDHGRGIGFDSYNNVYVTGIVGIGNLSTEGAFQESSGGSVDAYLSKYLPNGTNTYFTFLGGTSLDRANALAIDNNDDIVITGYTMSTIFPLANALQTEYSGGYDLFIMKFNHESMDLNFSTYYGGSYIDYSNAITTDHENNVIITGQSKSKNFPITHNTSYISSLDEYDAFIVKFTSDGSKVLFSTLFGGEEEDVAIAVDWYQNNTCIISGFTKSDAFPTRNAFQENYNGFCDMFVMKITAIEIADGNGLSGIGIAGSSLSVLILISITLIYRKRKKRLH